MEYNKIKGLEKPISRFVLGTMTFREPDKFDEYFAMLDNALANGINTIDSARGYGRGNSERAIVQWMKERGNREQVVFTTKGCHHSFRDRCHDFDISVDLIDSLCRTGLDYVDIFYMHRDDPKVPVKEIIDNLNWHIQEGRIKAIGVANWQIERVREANEYAEANGLVGISVIEEHYSIAEQLADPFNRGSGTLSGPKYAEQRKWVAENKMPVTSYSTLSGGFVTGRITRELLAENPDAIEEGVRRAYCHEVNFKRLDRTAELAAYKGISIPQVGLAYAMSGEMDVYPIIGAANAAEMKSSLETLNMRLTKAECDWIDCTSDEKPF